MDRTTLNLNERIVRVGLYSLILCYYTLLNWAVWREEKKKNLPFIFFFSHLALTLSHKQ